MGNDGAHLFLPNRPVETATPENPSLSPYLPHRKFSHGSRAATHGIPHSQSHAEKKVPKIVRRFAVDEHAPSNVHVHGNFQESRLEDCENRISRRGTAQC